jgi:hypothetical protein
VRSVAVVALAASLAVPGIARAVELEVAAQTLAQGYQLRARRYDGAVWFLNRRRVTQTLSLDVWDLLTPPADYGVVPRRASVDVFVSVQMRIDHDFGEWARGEVRVPIDDDQRETRIARDILPELGDETRANLDVLYGYVGVRVGRLLLLAGRLLEVDGFDWRSVDGVSARVRLLPWLHASASAGVVVRGTSFAGTTTFEPDGTSGDLCMAFAEDVGAYTPARECEQREALMPTLSLALDGGDPTTLWGRVAYRRTISPTPDGLYAPGAPDWGVNEELLALTVGARLLRGKLEPTAALRVNFLLGAIDEARVGATVHLGDHALTPETSYTLPSFDGDSIFNVFVAEPSWDLRLTYDLWPARGRWRGWARVYRRLFLARDDGAVEQIDVGREAWGAAAGVRLRSEARGSLRFDLTGETGYGGLRAGGDLSGRLKLGRKWALDGRLSLFFTEDQDVGRAAETTFGAQAGALYQLGPGAALHLVVEDNVRAADVHQLGVYALVDLAFRPEL